MTSASGMPEPGEAPPAVSVIIVNWNTRDMLRGCLRSIADETRSPHEVIVIDNASSDGSAAMVAEEFPEAVIVANRENKGFAAANNQGLAAACGAHVLLLNPDTIVLDGAIDRMLAWLAARPDVGCAGCQVMEDEKTVQRTCFADPGPLNTLIVETGLLRAFPGSALSDRPEYGGWDRGSARDVDVVSGMFMLVPRSVLEKVGPLDEAFFIYSEEADWCRRIRDAGYRCAFTPEARVVHLDGGGKSTVQIRSRMYVQMQKSKLIYVRKHYGWTGHALTRAGFVATAALRGAVFSLASLAGGGDENRARVRLARAALGYHLLGREPAA